MFNIGNREMQIKTTMRYHLTLVRMAIIKKKSLQIRNAGKDVEKGEHFNTVGEAVEERNSPTLLIRM